MTETHSGATPRLFPQDIDQRRYYAGVGSRETPPHIQQIMHHVACYLFNQGWTLRSGAASGADQAFERGVDDMAKMLTGDAEPRKEIFLPWAGYENSTSPLNPKQMPFSTEEMQFTAELHPAWHKCSPSAKLLHQRNTRIMLGCGQLHGELVKPVKFVVCWTQDGLVKGGTGQALRLAQALEIPVVNFGKARSAAELEAMVHEIDRLQSQTTTQN